MGGESAGGLFSILLGSTIAVRDGHPAILAERTVCDLDADRRLTSLVLAAVHHRNHARYHGPFKSSFDDLFEGAVFFYVCLENRVKQRVGW